MTAPALDKLIMDGERTVVAKGTWLDTEHPRISSMSLLDSIELSLRITGLIRGYWATWKINDNKLYLIDIFGAHDLIGNEPLFADWISGEISVSRGEVLMSYIDAISLRAESVTLKVENGIVLSETVVDNREYGRALAKEEEEFIEKLFVGLLDIPA